MKIKNKSKGGLLLIIVVLMNFVAFGQTSVQPLTKEEKEVTMAVEQLTAAMINADSLSLDNLCAATLSYGHSSGHVEGKKEFIDKISTGRSDFVSIQIADQQISLSGKTAVVRHILNAKTNDKGIPGEVHLKVLLIWQKQHGKWKLLARQAVKISS
jgi:ketosteroid isomerase-like protein